MGGTILSGSNNPIAYAFDAALAETTGILQVKHPIPYSDLDVLDEMGIQQRLELGVPLEFSHTLQTLMGGQLDAGLVLTGFYEDHDRPGDNAPMNKYFCPYIATRALKPRG